MEKEERKRNSTVKKRTGFLKVKDQEVIYVWI